MGILSILKKDFGLILSNKYILFLALKLYFILKLIFFKDKSFIEDYRSVELLQNEAQ